MQRLYVAANLSEAHLVRGLLTASGIAARVFNEYAIGAIGELPPATTQPEVWVDDERDLPRARDVIRQYEQHDAPPGSERCPACGEENPRSFAVCWNCQRPL